MGRGSREEDISAKKGTKSPPSDQDTYLIPVSVNQRLGVNPTDGRHVGSRSRNERLGSNE